MGRKDRKKYELIVGHFDYPDIYCTNTENRDSLKATNNLESTSYWQFEIDFLSCTQHIYESESTAIII